MIDGPRGARPSELAEVIRLSNSVFYPDGRILMERVLPTLFRAENAENLRVVVDAGKVAAMAGMVISDLLLGRVGVRAACIGSVCTAEAYRGQGLAAALMDDAVSHAVSRGASLALISGGRGLYRRMGCVDAGLFRLVEVTGGSLLPSLAVRARPWTDDDLPVLWDLHEKEAVRFVRTRADMDVLVRARAMFCRPAQTWVVEADGRPAAYMCVSGPDDRTGPGVLLAREIAGDRAAVLAAARIVLQAEGAERLQIETPAADQEMAARAASAGLSGRTSGMHGTLKIIHRSTFMRALGTHPELPEGPEDFAAALFGSIERPPATAEDGLPLALPGYGLSYI